MSCRHEYSLPHPDNICLDCECLSPEKCVEHQTLHPLDICDVGIRYVAGIGGYYCYTHNIWGKDWKRVMYDLTLRDWQDMFIAYFGDGLHDEELRDILIADKALQDQAAELRMAYQDILALTGVVEDALLVLDPNEETMWAAYARKVMATIGK